MPSDAPNVIKLLKYCKINVKMMIIFNVKHLRVRFKPYCRMKCSQLSSKPLLSLVAWWWCHNLSNKSGSSFVEARQWNKLGCERHFGIFYCLQLAVTQIVIITNVILRLNVIKLIKGGWTVFLSTEWNVSFPSSLNVKKLSETLKQVSFQNNLAKIYLRCCCF